MAKKKNEIHVDIQDEETFDAFLSEDDESNERADHEEEKSKTATGVSFEIDPYSGEIEKDYGPGKEQEYLDSFKEEPVEVLFDDDEEDEPAPAPVQRKPAPHTPAAPVVEDEDDEPVVAAPQKKKNDSQARIRELANQKRREEERAEAAERKLRETNAFYAKREIGIIEREVEACKVKLQNAISDNDAQAIVESQTELMNTLNDLNKFRTVVESLPEEEAPKPASNLSEAAQDWMAGKEFLIDNNEYKSLPSETRKKLYPVRTALAGLVKELIGEGYDKNDMDFYNELDLRLSSKFDFYEGLASMGLDALDSNSEDSVNTEIAPSPGAGVKQPQTKRTASDKAKTVPVSGPSTSSSNSHNASPKKKVSLSPAEMKWYNNHVKPHGVTLQEYAISVFEEQQKTKRT